MNVLIIGLGSIAYKHIQSLRTINPSVKILALRSKEDSPVINTITNIYALDEINVPLDFAILSNPTSEHSKWLIQLSELNVPLFIEKPLSSSLEIDNIIERISKKNSITYVACNLRFLDCIRFIKNYLTENPDIKINEVNSYCGSYLPDWRPNTDFRKSYSSNSNQGGGVHLDLIHELDYIYWFFGEPNFVSKTLKSQSSLSINSIDYANYMLDYKSFCVNVILNYYRRDPKRTIEIIFENETWEINLLNNSIRNNKGVNLFSSEQRIADTYFSQMNYFTDKIKKNEYPMNSIEDAYNVLKICLES